MLTILIALAVASFAGFGVWEASQSIFLSGLAAIGLFVGINVLVGRYISKKLTVIMQAAEKDIKSERYDMAIEKLKSAYPFAKWQFMVRSGVDGNIGTLYYARKKFDEAKVYLEKANAKNWQALCMLASYYYKNKEYDKAYGVMEKAVSGNKKEAFVYSLSAYFLSEQGKIDKAIEILGKGVEKLPLDQRMSSGLDSLKNNKKIKMQNYGHLWMQLHLGKMPEGVKQYQAFIANQKFRRR